MLSSTGTPGTGSGSPGLKQNQTSWVIYIILGGLVLCAFIWLINTKRSKAENDDPDKGKSGYSFQKISITEDWSEPIYFDAGTVICFKGATVPYCAKNANEKEECSRKKEDISSRFGKEQSGSLMFMFKSQGNEEGEITIKTKTSW